jgi:exopolyphosphatase / guanosine-5'-triphosphate,3'-diphosphate pyrophosphatase
MRITRLGEGVDRTHSLQRKAVTRTLEVLRDYRSAMDGERVAGARLVATSAVRDATDGEGFLRSAEEIIGVPAELLTGEEEGRLSYLGATKALAEVGGTTVVLDIGGGSTELVLRAHGTIRAVSMEIGCVRLTERFLRSDPPREDEVAAARAAIGAELDRAVQVVPELARIGGNDRLVGLAGTVSTLAVLDLELPSYDRDQIHLAVLTRAAVEHWCQVLGAESIATRALRDNLPEGRRDVIFGGVLVLAQVMRRLAQQECVVSEADILDGLVLSLCPGARRSVSKAD